MTRPADTSLISITANFGPPEDALPAANASKRVRFAITYHNHGSNNGDLAMTTKQIGMTAIAKTLLAICLK